MTKQILVAMAALLAGVVSLGAHHTHPADEWDLQSPVSIEGTVVRVYWGLPHAWFKVVNQEKQEYHVEWTTPATMAAHGIPTSPIKEGDRVTFTGVLNRGRDKRILALLTEIRRPADGWRWAGWDMPAGAR